MKTRPRIHPRINQAPTADIAFLLLIFFIATTIFGAEFGLPLTLPLHGDGRHKVPPENVVTLRVTPEGVISCDEQPVALAELRPILRRRLAGNDKLIVRIEPHAAAPYQSMIHLLDEAKAAGARRISLAKGTPDLL